MPTKVYTRTVVLLACVILLTSCRRTNAIIIPPSLTYAPSPTTDRQTTETATDILIADTPTPAIPQESNPVETHTATSTTQQGIAASIVASIAPSAFPNSANSPTPIPASPTSAPVVWPTPSSLTFALDIPYVQGPLASRRQELDVYTAPNFANRPVMIWVHGGSWSSGNKSEVYQKDEALVHAGYVFVSINYRLTPDAVWPEHAQDVAAAIAWVHANIAQYGGNPNKIFLLGHSAGAHLVSLVGTNETFLQAYGLDLSNLAGVVSLDTRAYDLNALDDFEGLTGSYTPTFGYDPAGWAEASPINHIAAGKNIPPFAVVWSEGSPRAKQAHRDYFAYAFANELIAAGVNAIVIDGSYHSHNSINREFGAPGDAVTAAVFDFLASLGAFDSP